jgi:T-complex protein 1 subunit alpha
MKALHTAQQEDPDNEKYKNMQFVGLDLLNGKIRNNLKEGVLEPLVSKVKCIRYHPLILDSPLRPPSPSLELTI